MNHSGGRLHEIQKDQNNEEWWLESTRFVSCASDHRYKATKQQCGPTDATGNPPGLMVENLKYALNWCECYIGDATGAYRQRHQGVLVLAGLLVITGLCGPPLVTFHRLHYSKGSQVSGNGGYTRCVPG